MKYFFLTGIIWAILFTFYRPSRPNDQQYLRIQAEKRKLSAITCSPLRDPAFSPVNIPLLPGTGKHHWDVHCSRDSAQRYFDQGMNLYYSFHIIEALASFKKAQTFDPYNPMLYWAEALSYGPNINDYGYAANPGVFTALEKAKANQRKAGPIEKLLIEAIVIRYSSDSSHHQDELNMAYRDAMASLYHAYPENPEVLALYADALMLIHPWDLYDHDGNPKRWTGEIVSLLEKGLKLAPDHPGINHYYIHAVEASRTPERALPSADRLGSLAPAVSHMVHMPSHIYIRTGNYEAGIRVNKEALHGYNAYLKLYPAVAEGLGLYQLHNAHMMADCAIMNGNSAAAAKTADECKDNIPAEYFASPSPLREYVQYLAATPVFANIRYGKWDELIRLPDSPDTNTYQAILTKFGKGMAYARLKDMARAEAELQDIKVLMEKDPGLKIKFGVFNSGYDGALVAYHLLAGIIEEEKWNYDDAINQLKEAVELEKKMIYNEPKDWLLPPLPYLGSVYLKKKNYADAEKAFREDLTFNPHNCWALKGLEMSLTAQGKTGDAAGVQKDLEKALRGSDISLDKPVF